MRGRNRWIGVSAVLAGVVALGLTVGWLQAGQDKTAVFKVGDTAADFTLKNQEDKDFSLSDALGEGPVVLAFYPGAFTKVCTEQLCEYAVNLPALRRMNATILGISADQPEKLKRFKEEKELGFTLLSDPKGDVARTYGAWYGALKKCKRGIVILDKEGKVLSVDMEPNPGQYKKAIALIEEVEKLEAAEKTTEEPD